MSPLHRREEMQFHQVQVEVAPVDPELPPCRADYLKAEILTNPNRRIIAGDPQAHFFDNPQ